MHCAHYCTYKVMTHKNEICNIRNKKKYDVANTIMPFTVQNNIFSNNIQNEVIYCPNNIFSNQICKEVVKIKLT